MTRRKVLPKVNGGSCISWNSVCSIDTAEIEKNAFPIFEGTMFPNSSPKYPLYQLQAVSSDFGPSDPVSTHLRPDSSLDNVSHAIEQAWKPEVIVYPSIEMLAKKYDYLLLYSTTCKTKTTWNLKWKVVWLMLLLGKVSAIVILGERNMLTANFNKFMNRNRLWLNRLAIKGEHLWRLVENWVPMRIEYSIIQYFTAHINTMCYILNISP